MSKGFIWDDIVAMYRKLIPPMQAPRASHLITSELYALCLIAHITKPEKPVTYIPSGHNYLGIPIIIDPTMLFGEWEIRDQYNNIMQENRFDNPYGN